MPRRGPARRRSNRSQSQAGDHRQEREGEPQGHALQEQGRRGLAVREGGAHEGRVDGPPATSATRGNTKDVGAHGGRGSAKGETARGS